MARITMSGESSINGLRLLPGVWRTNKSSIYSDRNLTHERFAAEYLAPEDAERYLLLLAERRSAPEPAQKPWWKIW